MCMYCYVVCNYNECAYLRWFVNREQMLQKVMKTANKLKEQINCLYENKSKKNLIRKFLYNQEINLEHKITSVEEIREDIVNMVDKRSILKKISRYNHNLDKLLYNVNRELGIK